MSGFDNSSEQLRDLFENMDSNEAYPVAPTGEVVPWPKAPTGVIMPNAPQHDIELSALRNSTFNKYVSELLATVRHCELHCNRTAQMAKHLTAIDTLTQRIIILDNEILMKGGRRTRKRNTRNKRRRNTHRK
jgi:hypothetical protein